MSSVSYYTLRRLGHALVLKLRPASSTPQENPLKLALLITVACCGGMLPICNLAMISSAYLALSGDFNTDLVNFTALILGNLMMMCITPPLTNYIQRALGLRVALLLALGLLAVSGTGTALSSTMPGMCFGYSLMGLGGCLFFGLAPRIIAATAPQHMWRGLALGWMFSIGFSSSLGPWLGGVLVEQINWRSLFFLTPLVTLPSMAVVLTLVPDKRHPPLPKLDRFSFALLMIMAASAVYAVCYGQTIGWNSTLIKTLLFICPAALFLLLVSCLSAPIPILHIRNFWTRGVIPGLMLSVLTVAAHVGLRIEIILYGRYIMGYTPTQIAMLFFLPLFIYLLALAPSALMVARSGPSPLFSVTGLSLLAISGLLLSRLDANAGRWFIIFALCIDYAGYAIADATINPLILRNIPPDQQAATLPAIASTRFFFVTVSIGILTPMNVQLKQHYLTRLAAQVTESSTAAMTTIGHWQQTLLAGGSTAGQARHGALSLVESSIQKQASIFTFDHLFLYMALLSVLGIVCAVFCRRHPFSHYLKATLDWAENLGESLSRIAAAFRIWRGRLRRPAAGFKLNAIIPLALMVSLAASGCALGPDYRRPEVALPAPAAQEPADLFLRDRWWEVFDDSTLNRLVDQALERNLDMAQALARVEAARAEAGIAFASRLPAAELSTGAGHRQMTTGEQMVHHYESRVQDSYYGMPALSFEIDFWGKYKRMDEAARAALLATEAARDAVRLALTAETVRAYFLMRTLQEQIRLASDMIAAYDRTCAVYERRYRLGQSPEITLRRFEAERAKTRAMMLHLEQSRIHTEGALAVLIGASPREIIEETPRAMAGGRKLAQLVLPPDIPQGLPSNLLRRRPDVRAAEGKLIAANALIGARMADFFPSFSLTGNLGYSSTVFNEWFGGSSGVWNMAGKINLPLFEGGRLKYGLKKQEALYNEAKAAYYKSIQDSFKETRDALADIRISRQVFAAAKKQVSTLTRSHDIMTRQYDAGLSSVMDLLDVRRQLLAAQQDYAEARRLELDAVVLLCKSMGGGWTEEYGFAGPPENLENTPAATVEAKAEQTGRR